MSQETDSSRKSGMCSHRLEPVAVPLLALEFPDSGPCFAEFLNSDRLDFVTYLDIVGRQLPDRLCDDLGAPLQGKHAVIPESVVQRPTDMDEAELVLTGFVGKRCDNDVISVTDDRVAALVDKPRYGRSCKLTDEQYERFMSEIQESGSPQEFDYDHQAWHVLP